MKNKLWLVYVAVASVATLGYFATGHLSYVINVIGLSSPVLIVVALRTWRPEKRLPWIMFALGMFTFLLGAALRLAVGAGRKPMAFRLIVAAIVALFITDAFYAWVNLYTDSGYQPGSGYLEAGWIAF